MDQSSLSRVVVQVLQLPWEFALVPNVAVVVAFLPERTRMVPQVRVRLLDANLGSAPPSFREGQLQVVHRVGQSAVVRLAHQQVNVLGHDHVSVNGHGVAVAHAPKDIQRRGHRGWGNELRLPVKARKWALVETILHIRASTPLVVLSVVFGDVAERGG